MTGTAFRTLAGLLLAAVFFVPAAAAPIEMRQGEVAILHGGVGAEERAAIEQKPAGYNLRLTFAAKGSGAYLSQVRTVIRNARGETVVDVVASGPLLYARLPQGEYTVQATHEGTTLTQKLAVAAAGRREWVFRFDAPHETLPREQAVSGR